MCLKDFIKNIEYFIGSEKTYMDYKPEKFERNDIFLNCISSYDNINSTNIINAYLTLVIEQIYKCYHQTSFIYPFEAHFVEPRLPFETPKFDYYTLYKISARELHPSYLDSLTEAFFKQIMGKEIGENINYIFKTAVFAYNLNKINRANLMKFFYPCVEDLVKRSKGDKKLLESALTMQLNSCIIELVNR